MAYECKGRYQIMAYLMPTRYLKTARYISKGKRISDFAADDITKEEKSYHFSDSSSKDRRQTCSKAANVPKVSPDPRNLGGKRIQPGSNCNEIK